MINIGLYTKAKPNESTLSSGGFMGNTTIIKDLYWSKDMQGTVWNDSPTRVDNDFTTRKIYLSADAYIEFKNGAFHFSKGIYSDSYISAFGTSSGGTGGGGGVSYFKDLEDIKALDFNSSDTNKTIIWNGSEWVKGNAGGGSGIDYFKDLTDIKALNWSNQDYGKTVIYTSLGFRKGTQTLSLANIEEFSDIRFDELDENSILYYDGQNWDVGTTPFDNIESTLEQHMEDDYIHHTLDEIKAIKVNNAGTADKLKTTTKLWGNDYNGTQDIFGSLQFDNQLSDAFIKYENGAFHFTKPIYSDGYISAFGKNDNQPEITGYFKDLTDIKALNFNSGDAGKTIVWNGYSWIKGNAGGGTSTVYWDDIYNKPDFATVATTGNYNDLTNKPTIPTKILDLTDNTTSTSRIKYSTYSEQSDSAHKLLNYGWNDSTKTIDWENTSTHRMFLLSQQMKYSATPTNGYAYQGSSSNSKVISFPSGGTSVSTSAGVANVMDLRIFFNNNYYRDIFVSPNNEKIYSRAVIDSTAKEWTELMRKNLSGHVIDETTFTSKVDIQHTASLLPSHYFMHLHDTSEVRNVYIHAYPSASDMDKEKYTTQFNFRAALNGNYNALQWGGKWNSKSVLNVGYPTPSAIRIGDAMLSYDSTNHALKIEDYNSNKVMNLYTTGGVSALGMSSNPSTGNIDNLNVSNQVKAKTLSSTTTNTDTIIATDTYSETVNATDVNCNNLSVNSTTIITSITTDSSNRLVITLQNGKKYQLNPIN